MGTIQTRSQVILIVIFFLAAACASTQSSPSQTATDGDGASFETAVVVKSISEEYKWIQLHYPGSQVQSQALMMNKKKPYDVLTFQTPTGETRKAYFDISSFFGKGF